MTGALLGRPEHAIHASMEPRLFIVDDGADAYYSAKTGLTLQWSHDYSSWMTDTLSGFEVDERDLLQWSHDYSSWMTR